MKKTTQNLSSAKVSALSKRSNINFDEVTKLIGLVDEKKLTHFELETQGFKIIIGRSVAPHNSYVINSSSGEHAYAQPQRQHPDLAVPVPAEDADSPDVEAKPILHYITSPMVGTFYRAPDPSAAPFIDVGDAVRKKQTLCIVEAMKLMNEIECDVEGVVKEIYVDNGKPVEFGQRLFGVQLIP
jgi:acetyl-CoA carboxylase biotin carboxyl carrier protein